MKLASIDIGSNAARLLLVNVFEHNYKTVFRKESLVRVPVRLGFDTFSTGEISLARTDNLLKTMVAFKYLMEVHDVQGYKACATAAMREAKNGSDIVKKIHALTGIQVEIVSGRREASIIYSNRVEEQLNHNNTYLYIDIGGGSTELSLFHKGKVIDTASFPIGTIRLLYKQVREGDWLPMKKMLKKISDTYTTIYGIGTGGNINKLYKLFGNTKDHSLSRKSVREAYQIISGYSFTERVSILGLKPDRADVIVPAAEILLLVTKWAGIEKTFVPKIGLADGLIHELFNELYNKPVTEIFYEDDKL
ncbi:MAG: exopolyphosphatase [Chitinophagales bacterium]|nr:MAG: exopolyphosphatase [Chitinophagales bacterium]